MSTYKSIDDIIKEIENWLRLSTLLHSGLKESLLAILHNDQNDPTYNGLLRDPTDMYNELNTTHRAAIIALKNRRILSQTQYDKLLPNSGTTDSNNFDITLTAILIINLTGIPPPATGWNHWILPATDNSKAANVIRVREWRNFVHHTEPKSIDNVTFTNKWKEGVTIINTLGYNFDSNKLLNCSLDPKILQQQSLLFKALDEFCKNEVISHGENIKEMQHTIKLHKNKLSELDNQMKTIQTDVSNLDVQLQTNISRITEQNSEMKSTQADFNLRLKHLESTKKECIGEKMDGTNSKKLMEVISYLPNGCIIKIKVKPSYQIQSVKVRCITTNYESDVIDVKKYQEFNDDDSKNVYYVYEVRDLNDETMLLKIGNLKSGRTYEIQLETNQHRYVDEMTIPDSASCTHVTHIDDTDQAKKSAFIVLTPPLGHNNEPLNCRQGFHGRFVNDSHKQTICISNGAGANEMTVKDFEVFSRAYLIRNFSTSENVFVVFPLIQMISDLNIQQVAEIFYKFLLTRNNFRAVITNLNSTKYIECYTTKHGIAHEDLPYHNRLQVFDQTTASVLNIRVITSTNLNEDIHKEIEHCAIDLQCFVSSHRHHLCNCYVIGVLAFPNLCRVDVESHVAYYYPKEARHHMKLFYLSKEDLQNVDNLQHWWSNTFEAELKNYDDHISNFNEDSFKNICAQSMATIALTELSPNLPTLCNNSYRHIISLLLNADQLEAIQSPSNRKIIIGNYGSGKSIVLEEIAKRRFYENLHTMVKVLILYVIWEEFSLVEITKKMLLDKLENNEPDCSSHITMASGNMHQIWNDLKKEGEVNFLGFLHHFLEESGYKTVHILIDELPTDVIEIKEVRKLNQLLKRHPNSSVTIAPQSIIIDRTTFTNDEEVTHNRNGLDQLEMDCFELVKVMRNTKQINAVVNASQNRLEDTETVLSVCDPSKFGLETKFKKMVTLGVSKLKRVFNRVPSTSDSRGVSNERKESAKESFPEDHSLYSENPSTESQSQASAAMPAPKIDKISKFLDSDEPTKKPTSFMKSTYKFHTLENGNEIEDQKPTLIKLPSIVDFESEMSARILKELLQKVCLKKKAQTMILCNSMNEIRQVSFCLAQIPDFKFITYIPQLQGIFPNTHEKLHVFSKFNEGSCLLTDNTGIKGLEAKRVIIFASLYEHFEMHNFTETLSRGNVWSYIFLHSSDKNEKRETLGGIIKEIEDIQLFDVRKVEMFEDPLNFSIPFIVDGSIYKVNKVCLMKQNLRQTFKDYQISFNFNYPVKNREYHYRNFFSTKMTEIKNAKEEHTNLFSTKMTEIKNAKEEHTIFHEVTYDGRTWSFYDVYRLLSNKDYTTFGKMFNHNRNILNYLRGVLNITFLILASWTNRVDVVEHLTNEFKNDIDVLAVNKRGWNAYHYAAMCDSVDVMKHLLAFDRSGLDVVDNKGDTPLHWAAIRNHKRMVNLLLDAGVSVDVVDNEGRTPDRRTVDVEIEKIIQDHRTKSSS